MVAVGGLTLWEQVQRELAKERVCLGKTLAEKITTPNRSVCTLPSVKLETEKKEKGKKDTVSNKLVTPVLKIAHKPQGPFSADLKLAAVHVTLKGLAVTFKTACQ